MPRIVLTPQEIKLVESWINKRDNYHKFDLDLVRKYIESLHGEIDDLEYEIECLHEWETDGGNGRHKQTKFTVKNYRNGE